MVKYTPFLIVFVCCLVANAQQDQYRFKSWDQQKGLPANSCLSAMQDQNGYMWISTANGISRFNGIRFKEIGKYLQTVSIDGEVRKMVQDKQGVYWVASYERGLASIDFSQPKDKQVTMYDAISLAGQVCPPLRSIKCMLDDNNGSLWIGTESNGLFRFNKKTKTFSRWEIKSPYSGFSQYIRCLYQRDDGMIWVGIVNGIVYINPRSGNTIYPKTAFSGIFYKNQPTVRGIAHWNLDTFAVATDRGAHFYISSSQQFTPVFPIADTSVYKFEEHHDVIKISDDELWFATVNQGIWCVNRRQKTNRYSWQKSFPDETVGMHPVYHFLQDRDKNIWVSHSKGLSYLNRENVKFKNLPFPFHVTQPPGKNFIAPASTGVAIIRPDSLFSWQLSAPHPAGIALSYHQKNAGGVQVWRHKTLGYVFASIDGCFYADTLKHRAVPVFLRKYLPAEIKNSGNITQLFFDTIGNKEAWWFAASETSLLYRYDWDKKSFRVFNLTNNGSGMVKQTGIHMSRILKDPGNGIWIATRTHGLFYMPDRNKESFLRYTPGQSTGKQIPGDFIEDLVLDNKQQMWATIRGVGLVQIDWKQPQQLSYTVYGKERGLTYLNLAHIKVDDDNNLWISTANGLYRFDQAKKWFSHFGQSNGIRNAAFTLGSAKDQAGNLYFSSTDHLLWFNPKDFLNDNVREQLPMISVHVNDRNVEMDGGPLKLTADENSIRFEFDILDFDNPTGHYFLCRLDGYDKNWIMLQDVFQQTYRSLPGGQYTFRVKKVNADGVPGKEINLSLNIADYFYNTTWFRILSGIFAAMMIVLAFRFYVNRKLEKQRILLEKKQAVELERLRISAELHDDVGGELSAIRLVSEMAQMNKSQDHQAQFVKISASSASLVQKMNEIVWALNINNDTLQSLVSYLHRYSVKFLDNIQIECSFRQPSFIPCYEMDGLIRRNIFLMVKEALNNVAKHSGASAVVIDVSVSSQLKITIHDNGVGTDVSKMKEGHGNGIESMQRRIEDLGGTMEVNNNQGTIVQFTIPLHNIHTKVL